MRTRRVAAALPTISAALIVALVAAACHPDETAPESVGQTASAVSIPGLFGTGVDASGTPLAVGSVDPHYTLVSTDPAFPGPNAIVPTLSASWTANTTDSTWISVQTSNHGNGGQTYRYQTTFSLSGFNPASATISGGWACDHSCNMFLNGTNVGSLATGNFGTLTAFTIAAGGPFVAGTNILSVSVNTTSGGPTGVQIGHLTSNAVVVCTQDSQCTSAQFCNTMTDSCTAKLANGTTIPTVSGHSPPLTGVCTAGAGAAVCVSGICDTKDNACGYANGDGPCTSGNGGTICRSTICATTGPNTGLCEACNTSSDCSGTTPVCDPTKSACVNCNGDNGSGATDACPTTSIPYCSVAGSCAKCSSDTDCTTGTHSGPFCNTTTGACTSACQTDAECGAGNWCNNLSGPGACQPKLPNGQGVSGQTCSAFGTRACISAVCDTNDNLCGYRNGDGPCTGGGGATVCRSSICATSGPNAGLCEQCITSSSCSGNTPVCDATSNSCVACTGDDGSGAADACASTTSPYCTAAGACGQCTTNADCTNGTHNGPVCDTTTGACEKVCTVDGDCTSGSWCNNLSVPGVCQPKVPNGQPVPGGSCTQTLGSRACVSAVCDVNGNDCGYRNGDGPCTSGTGGVVCSSTICGSSGANAGLCVACNGNLDCTTGTVCDPLTNTCGPPDAGVPDGGAPGDSGAGDSGSPDSGGGSPDSGSHDSGGGSPDSGSHDSGRGSPDSGSLDSGGRPTPDAGQPDAGGADGGPDTGSIAGGGCACRTTALSSDEAASPLAALAAVALFFSRQRRRRSAPRSAPLP